MKYVLILLLICTSCVTQRACLDKFPPQETTTNTVVYRDTVYFYRTDTDTIYAVASWMDTVNVSSGLIIGQAWVARDSIYINVIQRDTIIQWRDSVRVEIKEVTTTVQLPPEYSGKLWQWIILAGLILAGILLFTLKR